jgi:hypothetical protein
MPELANVLRLHPASPTVQAADTRHMLGEACAVVAVSEPSVHAAPGRQVRYEAIAGPVEFEGGMKETIVMTASDGKAFVDLRLPAKGAAIVQAYLVDDPRESVTFALHSEGTSDQLFLYSPPVVSVETGMITARIVACDHYNTPVVGRQIEFEALNSDIALRGEVTELGNGEYGAQLRTQIAGQWTICATDLETQVFAERCVEVLPGKPTRIHIVGEINLRADAPFLATFVRARLEDVFGNALDPHRIRRVDAGSAKRAYCIFGEEARFLVDQPRDGFAVLKLQDIESEVSLDVQVTFAAAWLQDPGPVHTQSTFRTPVFVFPPPGDDAARTAVSVRFDAEMVSFAGFTPSPHGGDAIVQGDQVSIPLNLGPPGQTPSAIYAGEIAWQCGRVGEVCFAVNAHFTFPTPEWKMCVRPKPKTESCICINIVYREGDSKAWGTGGLQAGAVGVAISANMSKCCPDLYAELNWTAVPADDWPKTERKGFSRIRTASQLDYVFNSLKTYFKKNCINFVMFPLARRNGKEKLGTTDPDNWENAAVIDPERAPERAGGSAFVGAHEIGHLCGLDHDSAMGDPDNIMSADASNGRKLTPTQCEAIVATISKFACP